MNLVKQDKYCILYKLSYEPMCLSTIAYYKLFKEAMHAGARNVHRMPEMANGHIISFQSCNEPPSVSMTINRLFIFRRYGHLQNNAQMPIYTHIQRIHTFFNCS